MTTAPPDWTYPDRAVPAGACRPRLQDTPLWWGRLARGGAVASLLAVTGLWLVGGAVGDLVGGGPDALTSVGRVTGLVASDLLLLQVLLMARLPFVERSHGQDALARVHRQVGTWSFVLMAAHVLLVTVGYAAVDGRGPVGELVHLVGSYPGMLLAAAGTALVVMVGVTSARVARRRLRYESWHLLHLYAYLGVGLALPHQLWTGGDFVGSPLAAAWWWSAWAATALAVVTYRVVVPLWRSWRHALVVERVDRETPGVVSVTLTGRRLDRLPVRAGQFFLWRFLNGPGWSRAHPYSLSAAPDGTRLRITVKDLGDGSGALARLRPGTRALVEGPYGRLTTERLTPERLTPERHTTGRVLLLASGVGVTPLRAVAEELLDRPDRVDVVLLHRTSTDGDAVFRDELDALARNPRLRVVRLVGPRATGADSWLPRHLTGSGGVDVLRGLVPDVADRDVLVCGPDPWADAAVAAVRTAGVPAARVHQERFAW